MKITDIAELAGVSISTVSKALNDNDTTISKKTRAKVLAVAKKYNYQPYANMRNSKSRTMSVGVVLKSKDINSTFVQGMLDAAKDSGYSLIIKKSDESKSTEKNNMATLKSQNPDGLILEPVAKTGNYDDWFDGPYRTLLLNETHEKIDFRELGYFGTNQLFKMGHLNIGCLVPKSITQSDFVDGYQSCLRERGRSIDTDFIYDHMNDNLIEMISRRKLSGILVADLYEAERLYNVLTRLNYSIPNDFSILSLNNYVSTTSTNYISTYEVPNYSFGQYVIKKLVANIEQKTFSEKFVNNNLQITNHISLSAPAKVNGHKITVVGGINTDTYLNIDKLPQMGQSIRTSHYSTHMGGKGLNQAIGITKLGEQVNLIGSVGGDINSDEVFTYLNTYGVPTAGISRIKDAQTGKATIFVARDGNSLTSIMSGANYRLSPEDIQDKESLFEDALFCLVQTELPIDTVVAVCKLAKQHHMKVILKPTVVEVLPSNLLQNIDYLIPNVQELNIISPDGKTTKEKAQALIDEGVATVIVTMDEKGCYVLNERLDETIEYGENFESVDATGSSDAFMSALTVYLVKGYQLETAIKIGIIAAGFSITREGVSSAVVDRGTLERYVSRKYPRLLKDNG